VMRSAGQMRRVRIRLASPEFPLESWLAAHPGVTAVLQGAGATEFIFPGNDAALAALIREAVLAGAAIYSVEEKTDSLEELFARLSSGEVM
jgi:hypothetical protein